MFLNIDLDSKLPIYEQIENQIIIGISKGSLEPGEILPSVRQLGIDLDSLRVIIAEYSSRGYSKKEITDKIQEIIKEVKSNE